MQAPKPKRQVLRSEPVPIRPATVTQQTCLCVLGLTPRQFLDLLRDNPNIPRANVGRLRVVRLEAIERFLDSVTLCGQPENDTGIDADDCPTTVDGVLASLGLERR